jgi:hypothetical protein
VESGAPARFLPTRISPDSRFEFAARVMMYFVFMYNMYALVLIKCYYAGSPLQQEPRLATEII